MQQRAVLLTVGGPGDGAASLARIEAIARLRSASPWRRRAFVERTETLVGRLHAQVPVADRPSGSVRGARAVVVDGALAVAAGADVVVVAPFNVGDSDQERTGSHLAAALAVEGVSVVLVVGGAELHTQRAPDVRDVVRTGAQEGHR